MDVGGKIAGVSKPILLLIANQDDKMKAHGDALEKEFQTMPNLTVGRYDGEHEQPENAFKDGGNKVIPTAYKGDGTILASAQRNPTPGESILRDPAQKAIEANLKVSKGVGCIGTITTWFASV